MGVVVGVVVWTGVGAGLYCQLGVKGEEISAI